MSSVGNKGKFSERLKKILKFRRRKKRINSDSIKADDSDKIYMNFVKVMAAIPSIVINKVDNKENTNVINQNIMFKNSLMQDNKDNSKKLANNISDKNRILSIDIDKIKSIQKNINIKNKGNINVGDINKNDKNTNINLNNDIKKIDNRKKYDFLADSKNINDIDKVKKLEKSIINIIKKKLIKTVNEMEIIYSELYILSEVNGENKVLIDCQRELNVIKDLLCKVDKLKEQYDFLKDNHDFEYLLEIEDNNLVDKIIELKDTFGNNYVKAVVDDYKLLEVYKYLYLKLDDLQEKTVLFEDKKKEEELKLKDRDINFEKLKNDVYNIEYVNRNYTSFVNNQNELLKSIDNKINKISSHEEVSYRLKGFNQLFMNSFKYFGLLMVSPLKGIIPSIATETIITGNLIKNLYKNLEWEESKKMVYEAIDYSTVLGNTINDLDNTNRIVDMTLDDIVHLKMRYNENFKKYQGDFLEYREIMHKISDMENKILGNKIKIEIMKNKALEQQRINNHKLILVKKLNN